MLLPILALHLLYNAVAARGLLGRTDKTHWGFNAPQALGSAILVLRAKPHGLKIAGEMGKSFGHCFKTGGKYEPGMAAMFTSKDWSFQ